MDQSTEHYITVEQLEKLWHEHNQDFQKFIKEVKTPRLVINNGATYFQPETIEFIEKRKRERSKNVKNN